MARVLVTGMSGAGKTTVLEELRRRGHTTVDTDYDGWELPNGMWDEQRMDRLLASHRDVVVSGTVENQGRFYDRFEHVVLLSAPLHVLVERVSTRTNNPYGTTPEQRAEIAHYLDTVEPLLRPRRNPRTRRTAPCLQTRRCHRGSRDSNDRSPQWVNTAQESSRRTSIDRVRHVRPAGSRRSDRGVSRAPTATPSFCSRLHLPASDMRWLRWGPPGRRSSR
jgi:shikimate kinase